MTTPHKHAEFVHAWADGKEIQQRLINAFQKQSWEPFDGFWRDAYEYRIKPAAPVIETEMTPADFKAMFNGRDDSIYEALRLLANVAIRRAIADGQVVPVVVDPNDGMRRATLVSCYFEYPFTVHGYEPQINILKNFMNKYDEMVGLRAKRDMAVAEAVRKALAAHMASYSIGCSTYTNGLIDLAAVIAKVKP